MTSLWYIMRLGLCLLIPVILMLITLHVLYNSLDSSARSAAFGQVEPSHYAIIVDCGSTGSRLYVYTYSTMGLALPEITPLLDANERPVVMKKEPGLSADCLDGEHPENATDHLTPLLAFAVQSIPAKQHADTGVYILATAGLRALGEVKSEAIMQNLRDNLPGRFNFHFDPENIAVITGRWEGVYAWTALNYALGNFQRKLPTAGIIDVGGGSLQVAFQVDETQYLTLPQEKRTDFFDTIDLHVSQNSPVREFRVYVTTFMGYGMSATMKRYEKSLKRKARLESTRNILLDPCIPLDRRKSLRPSQSSEALVRHGSGLYDACRQALVPLLNKTTGQSCLPKQLCTIANRYQPISDRTQFYGFSELWFSTNDLFGIGGEWNDTRFDEMSEQHCATRWNLLMRRFKAGLYPNADEARVRDQCFKSAWLSVVLHEGLQFPRNPRLVSIKRIGKEEVQWTIGTLLLDIQRKRALITVSESTSNAPFIVVFLSSLVLLSILLVYYLRMRRPQLPRTFSMPKMQYSFVP